MSGTASVTNEITEVRSRRAGAKPNNFSVQRSLTWGRAGRIIMIYDPRLAQPDALRLSRRRTRRGGGGRRRHRVRSRRVEIFRFRRVQQMPAALVVERAEFRAACAGCRSKGDDTTVAGAAHGAEPPHPARFLPRSRSALTSRPTVGTRRLRASFAPRAGE